LKEEPDESKIWTVCWWIKLAIVKKGGHCSEVVVQAGLTVHIKLSLSFSRSTTSTSSTWTKITSWMSKRQGNFCKTKETFHCPKTSGFQRWIATMTDSFLQMNLMQTWTTTCSEINVFQSCLEKLTFQNCVFIMMPKTCS